MSEQLPSDELLRCPFCGQNAEHEQTGEDEYCHVVRCQGCFSSTDSYITEDAAIKAWNKRKRR